MIKIQILESPCVSPFAFKVSWNPSVINETQGQCSENDLYPNARGRTYGLGYGGCLPTDLPHFLSKRPEHLSLPMFLLYLIAKKA